MRRALAVVVLALVLVALVAAPAMAQTRDPFVPLVQPGGAVDPGTGDPGTDPEVAPPFQPDEQVPNTGADTASWFGLAYALIGVGAGMVVLGRLYRSPAVPRRRA
jgi:hypothetical protein